MKVTRADVARDAGVTETVVSYVINNNRYVKAEKRERVLASIEKLGYVPNATARALAGKSSGQILILAEDLRSMHFSALINAIEDTAYDSGYYASLCKDRHSSEFLNNILSHNYDGILVGSTKSTKDELQRIINSGTPTVILEASERPLCKGAYGQINTGLYDGTAVLMKMLKEKGRNKIAYVHSIGIDMTLKDYRYRSFMEHAENPLLITGCESEEKLVSSIASAWRNYRFDGLVCRSDYIALIAYHVLQELGARIPEDVSVVSCNGTMIPKYMTPSLSAMRIRREEIVSNMFKMFDDIRKGKINSPEFVTLETEFIRGDSI